MAYEAQGFQEHSSAAENLKAAPACWALEKELPILVAPQTHPSVKAEVTQTTPQTSSEPWAVPDHLASWRDGFGGQTSLSWSQEEVDLDRAQLVCSRCTLPLPVPSPHSPGNARKQLNVSVSVARPLGRMGRK